MKFDELDRRMRAYETAHDHRVLPGIFMAARIDGRGFTRLTRERHPFDAPFDVRFKDMMVRTVEHLMDCGFGVVYGYTQSDEISLLFRREERTFGRKLRKYDSVLASEAAARFSLLLGDVAAFDCRISQLPTEQLVVDYFRWRHEDAARNALHGHCYWLLRRQGQSDREATAQLEGKSVADRNELLFRNGINFNDVPAWQKRGVGLWWAREEREGTNRLTGAPTTVTRKRLHVEHSLPVGDQYGELVRHRVAEAIAERPPDDAA
jgi:tRNA(His) 5'-end guanylyltransferase